MTPVEVAVNGYLNFKISDEYLANRVLPEVLERREKHGAPRGYEGMRIVLDYPRPTWLSPFISGISRNHGYRTFAQAAF